MAGGGKELLAHLDSQGPPLLAQSAGCSPSILITSPPITGQGSKPSTLLTFITFGELFLTGGLGTREQEVFKPPVVLKGIYEFYDK